jgi:hypothetical protein
MEVNANSEAGAITRPRAVTTETWVAALNYISPFLEPVTPDLVLYVSDMCTLYSLPTCVPYAAALLLYRLRRVPLLAGWTSNQAYLVAVVVAAKFLCDDPPSPRDSLWSMGWFRVGEIKWAEAEFCGRLEWGIAISNPELDSFTNFVDWIMMWA